jgi:hypothetical protein
MTAVSHLVEHQPTDAQVRIEGQVTQQQGCDPSGHALTVDDQDDRGSQVLGQ